MNSTSGFSKFTSRAKQTIYQACDVWKIGAMLEYLYETSIYTLIGFMFCCGVCGLYAVTYLFHASLPYCKSEARLEGKTVLITGNTHFPFLYLLDYVVPVLNYNSSNSGCNSYDGVSLGPSAFIYYFLSVQSKFNESYYIPKCTLAVEIVTLCYSDTILDLIQGSWMLVI